MAFLLHLPARLVKLLRDLVGQSVIWPRNRAIASENPGLRGVVTAPDRELEA